MRAIVIQSPGNAKVTTIEPPRPAPGEAVIRIEAAGICASDRELLEGTRPRDFCRYPIVPGHEWCGVVEQPSSVHSHLKAGTVVVAGGILFCGTCANCLDGRTNLCLGGYEEVGFTRQGGFAEWVSVPERSLHAVHADIPFDELALAEPAACVHHGIMRAAPRPGEDILVIGPGTLGLLAVTLFALHSPRRLVVLGDDPSRNALARSLGATDTILTSPDAVAQVREATRGGPSLVFECSGQPAGLEAALTVVRPGGRVILESVVGRAQFARVDSDLWVHKDLRIEGIMGATFRAFREVVALFESGRLRTRLLIRDRVPLESFDAVVQRLASEKSSAPKILLCPRLR